MPRYLHYETPPNYPPIVYTPRRDVFYRLFLSFIPLGLLLGALGPLTDNHSRAFGLALFDIGVLGSGLFLLVWLRPVKVAILALALSGILLQILIPTLGLPAWTFGLGGGLTAAAAAGLGLKEDHCFRLWEGRAVIPVYTLLALLYLADESARWALLTEILWIGAFLLQASFTVRKLRFPLMVVNYPEEDEDG